MSIETPDRTFGAGVRNRGTLPARKGIERRNSTARELLVRRIVAEFREMPCLRLTSAQAERLFGLRSDICARLIEMLVRDGVLRLDDEGRYATW